MDDGNGSFCVKAYKKSSLPKVPTREQLHRNYIRSRQEEKIELLRQQAPDTFAYFFELDENGWNLSMEAGEEGA